MQIQYRAPKSRRFVLNKSYIIVHSRKLIPIFTQATGNKPAAQAAGADSSRVTPPVGKNNPFSKIIVTVQPIQQF